MLLSHFCKKCYQLCHKFLCHDPQISWSNLTELICNKTHQPFQRRLELCQISKINWKHLPKDYIIDAWQSFKCTSLGVTFREGLFRFKIAGGVLTRLFGELCHRRLFGNLPKFFKIASFQNSGRLLQMLPEIIDLSLISLLDFF